MQKPIKHRCKNCKAVEEYTWPSLMWKYFTAVLLILGMLMFVMMVMMCPTYVMSSFSTAALTFSAKQYSADFRHLALEYTAYDGLDSFAFAYDLLENMPKIRYVLTSKFNFMHSPYETLEYGGDCKHMSVLFSSMMMSVGYDAFVDCSLGDNHCVVKIPYMGVNEEFKKKYIVVDLTSDAFIVYNDSVDHWADPANYLTTKQFKKENNAGVY